MPDGKWWTGENLKIAVADSYCYAGSELNCRRYGRLYSWYAAQRACLSRGGQWRLPSNDDWRQLAGHYGGIRAESADTGKAAYQALVTGGISGFDALLGGGRAPDRDEYARLDAHGFYWTASETGPETAWFYNFGRGQLSLGHHDDGEKQRALSVRCVSDSATALSGQAPVIDYHQHLFSPEAAALVTGNARSPGIGAHDVIALLDSAGIRRALVLSVAYTWGKASRDAVEDEYDRVRAENDWTSQQVAQYPDRLRAFCSFNPLRPYALEELERCSKDPLLNHGLKLHFGNSDVDLDNPENVAQVRQVFARANAYGLAIVVHIRTSFDNQRQYGADQARLFLNELLPAAPDVPVQIAHLAGAGGYETATDSALSVFTDVIARRDPRMNNVWFDATAVVRPGMSADVLEQIATRVRQIGVERVVYGSDAAASPLSYPRAGWEAFRRLPLTEAEFRVIADNIAPYARD